MSPKAPRAKAARKKAPQAQPSPTRADMPTEPPAPAGAVPPEQTVHDEYVVCLEDGKRFKTLKGHLRAAHDLSPEQYRTKWGLTADHPIVAPAYSARRSSMAKQARFGKVGRDTSGSRSRQVRTAA